MTLCVFCYSYKDSHQKGLAKKEDYTILIDVKTKDLKYFIHILYRIKMHNTNFKVFEGFDEDKPTDYIETFCIKASQLHGFCP